MANKSLITKIKSAFLLQAALIIVTALLSIYIATIVIDEILIKNAIQQEADYYASRYKTNHQFALPDTLNLTGYLEKKNISEIDQDEIPQQLGFHDFKGQNLVLFISKVDDKTLYLVYNRGQVDKLAAFYGLFPLALVLIVLYLALWLTYRFSSRTLSPVIRLAERLNKIDFNSIDLTQLKQDDLTFKSDDDIQVLHDAIINMGEKLESFIARERDFTRDASHELRSPLTVINLAADMLLAERELSSTAIKTIQRIKRAINDMEELTQAFLLLARESDESLSRDLVCINDVVREEIDRSEILKQKKNIKIHLNAVDKLFTRASDKVLSILIGNLIRNAILYTDEGYVEITLQHNQVTISDSGKGMDEQQINKAFKPYFRGDNQGVHGHGVGLTIVKRLSDRFNWPVSIDSSPGKGTTVSIQFPVEENIIKPAESLKP